MTTPASLRTQLKDLQKQIEAKDTAGAAQTAKDVIAELDQPTPPPTAGRLDRQATRRCDSRACFTRCCAMCATWSGTWGQEISTRQRRSSPTR